MAKRSKRGSKRSNRSPGGIPTHPSSDLTIAGQRRAVWEGRAQKTSGGLTRDDLMVSKSTKKIVSKRASRASKRNFVRNGLRPDKNIALKGSRYRGVQDHKVTDTEQAEWERRLGDE